ncbi:hypothetical protein BDZ85DRAFT_257139 [Elsinoe ampelina]|uniref:Uncharacterized protein n=1 Tax=Elsinoe ampelina TaxID=302913 RepID=A0A6A6GMN0_9PEZI|nr:hypothetical protein BDZ85DRAFT_257139 [Elsinoe ampelina]
MTSADFLTSGEWTGYYDYSRGHGAGRIDPMMHGIQFSIDSELGAMSGPACRGLTAPSCSDAVGNFELTGAISTQTGTVKLRKHYRGRGHTDWDWTAVMTPFGILGSWGSDTWGGWLWLWKKEWSDSTSAS